MPLIRLSWIGSFLLVIGWICQSWAQGISPDSSLAAWSVYRGDAGSHQYSSLRTINSNNVGQLEVAWTYHTRDQTERSTIQCNPIEVGGILYVTSPQLKAIALDAASGKERWRFDPFEKHTARGVNRGVTYWAEGDDQRILFSAGPYLYALDAATGRPVADFGDAGKIDLRENLGRNPANLEVWLTSPGIVYNNLLIVGSALREGYEAAPGHIRAYDIKSGQLVWTFYTIPQPGEFGYDTWNKNDWQTAGGTNSWSGMSLDKERGWVFAATGSPAFDFYGGNRTGQNLFGNCVLALDANTGKRIWHYQTVHHDLWDYDLPCAPNLVTVAHEGKRIDAVAQATKTGFVYLLNRETGQPLFPVKEQAVPASTIAGEQAWATQPIPTMPPPFVRQRITEADLTTVSDSAHRQALTWFRSLRHEGLYTPPSEQGTLALPGTRGGAEWGGASVDPETGWLYINANEMANVHTLRRVAEETTPPTALASSSTLSGQSLYQQHCASCHGADRKGHQSVYPSLRSIEKRMSRKKIGERIANGKGLMPAFAHLAEAERGAIADYLVGKEDTTSVLPASTSFRYVNAGYDQFLDKEGYPAIQPPWGTLNAIDLNKGKIMWQIPLGEFEELTRRGIPPTGTQNLGGCITTAGGLVFVGATMDEKFRAFDKNTGALLWETKLPAGGYATPSTYQVNGKQYIVIAAGGGGKCGTKSGDTYVAFTLPDE